MGSYDSGRASDLGGLNIEARREDSLNGIRFDAARSEPTSSNDVILYRSGTDLYWWNGTSAVNVSSGAGGGVSATLDGAYDNGRTVQVDSGAVVLAGVDEDTAVLSITGDGDSAGALLSFTHTTATRNDILGTGSTWAITGQGVITATGLTMADSQVITLGTGSDATIQWDGSKLAIAGVTDFANNVTLAASATITQTGVAGSTVFTITAGDVVMSDGSLSITDADNAETVTVINNTATTIGAAASAGVIQVESTSLTTGAAVNVQLTEGTLNGGFYYSGWDATAGARVFSVGENGVVTITGAGAANSLTITNGDAVMSDGSLSITDADNAETVTIINNTATTIGASASAGIVQVESTSLTTGAAVNVQLTEATLNGGWYFRAWDATAAAAVFSVGENGATVLAGSAAGTDVLTLTAGDLTVTSGDVTVTAGSLTLTEDADGTAVAITANAATTNNAMTLTANGLTTGSGLLVTSSGTITSSGEGLVNIVGSGITTGDALKIDLTEATLNGGNYINCYDDTATATVFKVAEDGATTIAGSAAGTDALTITAGDITVTSGYMNISAGGIQCAAVARTTTADGTGTGTIADGTTYVTVTSADANNILTLPTPTPGNVVWFFVGANGCELRSDTPASVAINGGTGASAESAIAANTLVRCICTSSTTWVCSSFSTNGTESAVEAAA